MIREIKEYFEIEKIPMFRYEQLIKAIFSQMVEGFENVTTFPSKLREELSLKFKFNILEEVESIEAKDSVKFILKTADDNFIETILMLHEDKRRTVCVSSQIFCPLGCKFCATGSNKYKRNLTTDEILWQVLIVNKYLKNKEERVTNIVYMGMGEPFLNYDNVLDSITHLNDSKLFNIGARHITISTAGLCDKIKEFANLNLQINLAISLHAPNDKIRDSIMPINKKFNIKTIMDSIDYYIKKTNRRVSFEYVLIKDINDSKKCANELVELLKGKLVHVNLLIYNPHEYAKFEKPDKAKVLEFKKILDNSNIPCSIRKSLGDDIKGACGQLSGKFEKKK